MSTFLKQLAANKLTARGFTNGVLNDHVPQWSKPLACGSDWIALAKWIEACRLNKYTAVRVIKSEGSGEGFLDNIKELHRSLFKYNSLNL